MFYRKERRERKDRSLFLEEQTITPVRDAHGIIAHFVSIKQDLTERKKLEAQLLRTQRLESVGQSAGLSTGSRP